MVVRKARNQYEIERAYSIIKSSLPENKHRIERMQNRRDLPLEIIVIEDDGIVHGALIGMDYKIRGSEPISRVEFMAVIKQRNGYGKELLNHYLKLKGNSDIKRIELDTKNNSPSERFFKKNGFKKYHVDELGQSHLYFEYK